MNVLMVNHREKACGVYQYGERVMKPLLNSTRYQCYYIDVDNEYEHDYWIRQIQPAAVLYNYYSGATMPWLTPSKISNQRTMFKQLCLFHELDLSSMGFDLILHQDPTNTLPGFHNMVRQIPEYPKTTYKPRSIPVIGSFGFGLGGKGFGKVVRQVIEEYRKAVIRLNIPYAHFGDSDGKGAQSYVEEAKRIIADNPESEIDLRITHDLLPEDRLLEWLAYNDINCFFYDENYGRGISGTIDYALAVHKPFAITRSWQFKHIWMNDDSMVIDKTSLRDLIKRGTSYLQPFHDMWNPITHIQNMEQAFDIALGKK